MEDTISVGELKAKKSLHIIDVREPDEYEHGHIEGAVNIPLGKLIRDERLGIVPRDREIVVHCKSGVRGDMALQFLKSRGYTNIRNLEGGFEAWKSASGI